MVDVIASTKLVDGNLDDGAVNNFANFSEIFTLLPASACSKLKGTGTTSPDKEPGLYNNNSKFTHIGHGFGARIMM